MCPPLAAVAALILLWIELTKALTVRIGMLFHSSINAFLSCARVAGGFRRFLTLLSSSSHMYSIGVKSGLYGGHASGAMLLFARKSWQTRATCGRVLSCCRIRLRCCTSGTATGRKISSLYLTAVILPATIINCDFIPWAMPSQTITEPPPNRSRSTTQFSATSVHTTSTICVIVNLDLSVKRTRLHCLIGNSLGACTANHAIRRNHHAWVRGRPTYGRQARRPISRNGLPIVFGQTALDMTLLGWLGRKTSTQTNKQSSEKFVDYAYLLY